MVPRSMTSNRNECGITKQKKGDTIKGVDSKTKKERDFTFVKEIIKYDGDGNIIAIQKIWQ